MAKLNKTLFLKIETDGQLNSLCAALEMQHSMEDDMVLDDSVTNFAEVRNLIELGKEQAQVELNNRRQMSSDAIDKLLSTIEVETNIKIMLDNDNN